jgi:hypothetical protein
MPPGHVEQATPPEAPMSTEAEPWVMMLGLQAIASPWREAGLPLMNDAPGTYVHFRVASIA